MEKSRARLCVNAAGHFVVCAKRRVKSREVFEWKLKKWFAPLEQGVRRFNALDLNEHIKQHKGQNVLFPLSAMCYSMIRAKICAESYYLLRRCQVTHFKSSFLRTRNDLFLWPRNGRYGIYSRSWYDCEPALTGELIPPAYCQPTATNYTHAPRVVKCGAFRKNRAKNEIQVSPWGAASASRSRWQGEKQRGSGSSPPPRHAQKSPTSGGAFSALAFRL